jgi:hypothetical protein
VVDDGNVARIENNIFTDVLQNPQGSATRTAVHIEGHGALYFNRNAMFETDADAGHVDDIYVGADIEFVEYRLNKCLVGTIGGNGSPDSAEGNTHTAAAWNKDTDGLYNTIQDAIDHSSDTHNVFVYPGTYEESIDFGGREITLQSVDPNDWGIVEVTVIDARRNSSSPQDCGVVTFDDRENEYSVLEGFTVKGGYATNGGGGILCRESGPIIRRCIIKDNVALANGGGMSTVGGSPSVVNCIFTGNKADHPNGRGGGVFNKDGKVTVLNSIFNNNSAYLVGAGIHSESANAHSALIVSNCTIVGNNTQNGYGGIVALEGNGYTCNLAVTNCIIWGNTQHHDHISDQIYPYSRGMPGVAYSCIEELSSEYPNKDDWGMGNIDRDPCFVNAGSTDFKLKVLSSCVDAGDNRWVTCYDDIDGRERISNHWVDIGAHEYDLIADAHWWQFSEIGGDMAADSIGTCTGHLWNGATRSVGGVFGSMVTLDTPTDRVAISALDEAYDWDDTFTVAGWFSVTNRFPSMNKTIVGQWLNHKPNPSSFDIYHGWQVLYDLSRVKARLGSGAGLVELVGPQITDADWHHFALVCRPRTSTSQLYVDGTLEDTVSSCPISSYSTKFRIGDGSYEVGGVDSMKGGNFDGDVDDVMIFERALLADEINTLYRAGL